MSVSQKEFGLASTDTGTDKINRLAKRYLALINTMALGCQNIQEIYLDPSGIRTVIHIHPSCDNWLTSGFRALGPAALGREIPRSTSYRPRDGVDNGSYSLGTR